MSTLAEQINHQIDAGRQTIQRSWDGMREMDVRRMPRTSLVAAGLVIGAVGVGVAWMVYRNRRRRTLVERLQDALPEGVRDLPAGVRIQVKRVRALSG